jgi:hypothetical protein
MCTILWCYLRNDAFKKDGVDYHTAADLTGQANHIGVTVQADIIKQKMPEVNGGYKALNMGNSSYGKFDKRIYTELCTDHPIDLTRYQVANGYMGRIGLINSGGASGKDDLAQAVRTGAVVPGHPDAQHHRTGRGLALQAPHASQRVALGDGQLDVSLGHAGLEAHDAVSGRRGEAGRRSPRRHHRRRAPRGARRADAGPPGPRRM